jgi:hypothetical protein
MNTWAVPLSALLRDFHAERAPNPNDRSPVVPAPRGEIIVMRDNGAELRRLALSRAPCSRMPAMAIIGQRALRHLRRWLAGGGGLNFGRRRRPARHPDQTGYPK